MKQEFVRAKSKMAAKAKCSWAVKIIRVEGGYQAFESWDDYQTWKNQT